MSKWSADLKKAESQTQTLGSKIQSALSPKALFAGAVGGLGGLFAASKVMDFLGDSIAAASNLGETISKTSQIMGEEALPGLEKWAEGAATAFGQSKQMALDAASTFAIFGKSAGLAGDDLVGFSTELTELSADFASFFNTSPEDAITAIGAALRGESEPIRRYGVLLDEATLRQRALKMGIITTISQALTPQQRVLAAQAEILAQSSDAQGDFARTSEGLANTQRILAAEFANVQVEIGEALLPIMLELAHFASETLIPALSDITQAVKDAGPVWDALGFVIARFVDGVKTVAAPLILLKEAIGAIGDAIGIEAERIPKKVRETGSRATAEMKAALLKGAPEVAEGAKVAITDEIRKSLREAREKAAEEARAIPGDISDALIKGMDDIEDGLDQLVDLMENSLSDAAKIARLKGVLASKELAAGLLDERADVRGAAMQLKLDAEAELKLLESGAADAAVNAGTTFAEQLRLQDVKARDAANAMLLRAKGVLQNTEWARTAGDRIAWNWVDALYDRLNGDRWKIAQALYGYKALMMPSSPSPPEGPLHDADKGAGIIGKAWTSELVSGLRSGLSAVEAALPTLGANGGVPMLAASLSAGSVAASGSTVNNTWNLTIGGVPYSFNSRDDFIKALDDLSAFGDGRLSG